MGVVELLLVVLASELIVAGVADQLVAGFVGVPGLLVADLVGAAGLAVLNVAGLIGPRSEPELAVTVDQIVVAVQPIHVDGCLG